MSAGEYAVDIRHLTKDYGMGRGVFNVTLSIRHGEAYGYLGPNGAGKSTTMRHLMGFARPQTGTVCMEGMNCWNEQKRIQKKTGYLPGEISFPDDMTGTSYLKLIAKMRGIRDFSYAESLLKRFEINSDIRLKKMSKGMKQKIGIVAAFMHDPEILLLDEPTSGLDPLMQNAFIELLREEKKKGKTILLSSHIFDEVEKTCDRIGMIRSGKLIQEITVAEMRRLGVKTYKVGFSDFSGFEYVKQIYPDAEFKERPYQMTVSVADMEINRMISVLSRCNIRFLKEEKHTLEEYFMKFYGGGEND